MSSYRGNTLGLGETKHKAKAIAASESGRVISQSLLDGSRWGYTKTVYWSQALQGAYKARTFAEGVKMSLVVGTTRFLRRFLRHFLHWLFMPFKATASCQHCSSVSCLPLFIFLASFIIRYPTSLFLSMSIRASSRGVRAFSVTHIELNLLSFFQTLSAQASTSRTQYRLFWPTRST